MCRCLISELWTYWLIIKVDTSSNSSIYVSILIFHVYLLLEKILMLLTTYHMSCIITFVPFKWIVYLTQKLSLTKIYNNTNNSIDSTRHQKSLFITQWFIGSLIQQAKLGTTYTNSSVVSIFCNFFGHNKQFVGGFFSVASFLGKENILGSGSIAGSSS